MGIFYALKKFRETLGFVDKKKLRFNPYGVATVYYTDTGEELFKLKPNQITLAGAGFLARSMFNLSGSEVTPSYNNVLGLDNTINVSSPSSTNKTFLFCVGTDGCGTENSQVNAEDYKHWIDESAIVPFQYRPLAKDINSSERMSTYFGRKTLSSFYSYYFKSFDNAPAIVQQLTDGTPIDSSIYKSSSNLKAQTIVNMEMSITPDDCRDFFIETTGIADARINAISLCTGWIKTVGGYPVYQDIRPITRLNFPNECLIDLNKGITIDYSVYF